MDDAMDIETLPVFDPTPTPNEEFCIFRAPGLEPQYLERYGITLFNPDPEARLDNVKFFIWSVFDLEDLGFKVFLDGHYNYKIEAGAEQGVKRFETSEYEPGVVRCPLTRDNLWFLSYRLNQLPSEHVFYPQRPPGMSNIPPVKMLKPGDLIDIQEAQMKEEKARIARQSMQNAPPLHTPKPFYSPNEGIAMYTELEKKLNEVSEAPKKWVNTPAGPRQTFNQLLATLVGPDAIKMLTMASHGAASVLQKRDASQYFRDLKTVPFWQRKQNNAATKITRAHFGLPVEPITDINILNAGRESNDTPMAVERDISQIQKQLSYGTPLDFLDEYTEPQMGQPGMIRARPKPEDLEYKRLPRDPCDLLYEYEAAKLEKRRPQQTCRVEHGAGKIIPELDFDDSFNFLEKYYMNDTIYGGSLRGGALPPDDSDDSDRRAASRVRKRKRKRRPFPNGKPRGRSCGGRGRCSPSVRREVLTRSFEPPLSNISKAKSLPETRTPNDLLPSPSFAGDHGRSRITEDHPPAQPQAPFYGTLHKLMKEREVYVDAEERSDAAIQKLCELNVKPACLEGFRSPPTATAKVKFNVDNLRPHLKQLIASGQLKNATELLGLAPALVADEENLKLRDACEPMLPIKFRSARAIKKLFELQGKPNLLDPNLKADRTDGKPDREMFEELRPQLPTWVRSGKILDIDGVFEKRWPHKKRTIVVKPPQKSIEEKLTPKRARCYDAEWMEVEFEVSLPVKGRSVAKRLKLCGLALNARPELVERYRDSKRELCHLRLYEDKFNVPTHMDADALIGLGGDPEMAKKEEKEEWMKYPGYRADVEAQVEPVRGGYLRGGAGSDSDSEDEPDETDESDEEDKEGKDEEEDKEEKGQGEDKMEGKGDTDDETQEVIDTCDVDGYPHTWVQEFYEIDIPISERSDVADFRLFALAMNTEPTILDSYGGLNKALSQALTNEEDKEKLKRILGARAVRELVEAGGRMPAKEQIQELVAFLRANGGNQNLLRKLESEPPELHLYEFKFLEDIYEIGVEMEKRSGPALVRLIELGGDEEMFENYQGEKGKLDAELFRGIWNRTSRWMLPNYFPRVLGLLQIYDAWKKAQAIEQKGQPEGATAAPSATTADPKGKKTNDSDDPTQQQKWARIINDQPEEFWEFTYQTSKPISERLDSALISLFVLQGLSPALLELESDPKVSDDVRSRFPTMIATGQLKDIQTLIKEKHQPSPGEVKDWEKWMDANDNRPLGHPSAKPVPKPPSSNVPKTPKSTAPFVEINGVSSSPEQMALLDPTFKKYKDLKAEKKALSQARPRLSRSLLPKTLRKPHFTIPNEDEEEDEEDDEEMALARLKRNGPRNDTPEGLAAGIKRYGEESRRKDRERQARMDFVTNRSVYSTEQDMPTVPEFGKGVEEAMTFNGGMPTLYLNNYSMKRMRELEDENRALQNINLERGEYCGMCDAHITFESTIQKDNHYRAHRSVATSCGFCGVSFDGMTDFEKKTHLKKHKDSKYGAQDQLVPYRNIDKKTNFPHDDVFSFCEACGIDFNSFSTPQEMLTHSIGCRDKDNSASRQLDKLDGDFYCHKCGENLSLETQYVRQKHVSECRFRQVLGADGRDHHLWTFASKNPPGGSSATELDLSRTYFHLLTLVDVPVNHDLGRDGPYVARCKFHGCRADLGNYAKKEKLMEHLGKHIGKRALRRDMCPYKNCDIDFTDYRKELLAKAEQDGTVYNDRDLGAKILEHMKLRHNAYYDAAKTPCMTCIARDVQNGDLSDDVQLAGAAAERQRLQDESKRIEAGRKKLDQDREKFEAERRQFEENKKKEQAGTGGGKSVTASKPEKTRQKEDKRKQTSKADGKNTASDDGKEDESGHDTTDFDDPPSPRESNYSVSGADSEDSDDPDNDDGSGGYVKTAKDPRDADAYLDDRPGVYIMLPDAWARGKTCLHRITEKEAPKVKGMAEKAMHPWTFGCRGCGKVVNKVKLPQHRSVTDRGKSGCGMDDDLELVVTTARHLKWYREEMKKLGRSLSPYESSPPLPGPPAKPFLWFVWRDLVSDAPAPGADELRELLLDASEELQHEKKITELPLLDGKKEKWKKSPYQKSRGKQAKAAETSEKGETVEGKSAGASTSADAAVAAESKVAKKQARKDKRKRDEDEDGNEDKVDDAAEKPGPRRSPINRRKKT